MIDVASRWAYIVPIPKVDSASILKVVEDRIVGDGIYPRLFITDNGSEFKKDFTDFCDLFQVKVRKSVPHHAAGHGIIEAFNRTIADVIGHMIEVTGRKTYLGLGGHNIIFHRSTLRCRVGRWGCPQPRRLEGGQYRTR